MTYKNEIHFNNFMKECKKNIDEDEDPFVTVNKNLYILTCCINKDLLIISKYEIFRKNKNSDIAYYYDEVGCFSIEFNNEKNIISRSEIIDALDPIDIFIEIFSEFIQKDNKRISYEETNSLVIIKINSSSESDDE